MTTTLKTLPPHGERRCYLRGCRQPECIDAHKKYCKRADANRYLNGPRNIDATPATAHLRRYIDAGWPKTGLAEAIGCTPSTISELLSGTQTKLRRETAARILAFQTAPETTPAGYWTTSLGTVRRLQALAVHGYPIEHISEDLGEKPSTLKHIRYGRRQKVSKDLARRVAAYYKTHAGKPGPSHVARGIARTYGWHGPLAWDDIDDPTAVPDTDNPPDPELSRDELAALRREEIWLLGTARIDTAEIAARVGVAKRTAEGVLTELRTGRKRDRKQKQEVAA